MEKFNNTSLVTGYIKQLLATFNLPKFRVYTKENAKYFAEKNAESSEIIESVLASKSTKNQVNSYDKDARYVNYIKGNKVQRYIDGRWVDTPWHYHYNKRELNQTKNLIVKNNVYDSYTHEYLGDYLRFQRDYNGVDLMPLYNCFSNVICQQLDLSTNGSQLANFKTTQSANADCKIYMLPVKLFKKYTIAIDCSSPIEICCGFYSKYQDKREKLQRMPLYTYKKINCCIFGQPFVYDKLSSDALKKAIAGDAEKDNLVQSIAEFAQYEYELKMFIKMPIENNSTITILEGDYSGYNQGIILGTPSSGEASKKKTELNHFVTNYETTKDGEADALTSVKKPSVSERDFKPYCYLQLLLANTKESHPFSDRLIEYLTGNAITDQDDIYDDIVRVQKTMEINEWNFDIEGAWDPKIRNIAYDYMTSTENDFNTSNIAFFDKIDCLGYIDKDVEKYYAGWKKIGTDETAYTQVTSISNIDIYPEMYKDSKKEGK